MNKDKENYSALLLTLFTSEDAPMRRCHFAGVFRESIDVGHPILGGRSRETLIVLTLGERYRRAKRCRRYKGLMYKL